MSELDQLSINALRFLAVDAVEKAKSGHPGAPLGDSPTMYLLFHEFMRHNPAQCQVEQSRPLCALQRACVGDALRGASPDWLQGQHRRSAAVSPVWLDHPRPSRVRRDRRGRSDHRPAGPGFRHGRGHGHRGESISRRSTTVPATTSSTTTPT